MECRKGFTSITDVRGRCTGSEPIIKDKSLIHFSGIVYIRIIEVKKLTFLGRVKHKRVKHNFRWLIESEYDMFIIIPVFSFLSLICLFLSSLHRLFTLLVTFFLTLHLLCLPRVTVFGLMAEPSTGAAFALVKESAVDSLVTTSTTWATAFGIPKATLERWLGGIRLVNSIFLFKFPSTSQSSYGFLLENSDELLGRSL